MGPCLIAVAAVGDVPAELVAALEPVLRESFGCEVAIVGAVALPEHAFDAGRGQHRAAVILDALARARLPSWDRLLGVAGVDLFAADLNFVFGEADAGRGVAVFSLARLRAGLTDAAAGRALFLRRAATEAIHELGHTYGLGHCRDARCVMWFSNTLAESDHKGTGFCTAHAAALRRAAGR
jgi:archaemetzincin